MSMTPLALLKSLNPNNINAAISGPKGIKGFVDGLKGGTGGGAAERKGVVDKLKIDGEFRTKVQDSIRSGNTANIVRDLKAAGYTSVNEGNLAEKLRELDADLQAAGRGLGADRITQAEVDRITGRGRPPAPAPAPAPAPGPPRP
jgi:hypothetical protein